MAYAKIIQDGNTLIDLTQDTVNAESMLSGTTAHKNDGTVVTGTIQNQAAQTIIPTTTDQTIASGKYLTGTQTIKGDANLMAANIAKDVTIFGVTGTHEGGGGEISGTDVMFYDYDGSVVAGYSAADFASLTELPANPTHTGLTAQGWNWSLADAKTYVAKYEKLNIGQMYITDDGKTRVYIHLTQGRTSPRLGVCPNGTVDVDWGDGTTHDTLTGTSTSTVKWTPTHNYATPGDYVIKLTVTGSMNFYGSSTSKQDSGLLRYSSSSDARNYAYHNAITKVEIGTGVTSVRDNAFRSCYSISSITIPNCITSVGGYAFYECYSLSSIVIPDSVTNIEDFAFYSCNSLSSIVIPDNVTSIEFGVLNSCSSLSSIVIPDSVTSIGERAFYSCNSLSSIVIPDSVTSIGSQAFCNCRSLSSITIPDGVTSIGNYMFQYCYSLSSITILDGVTSIGTYAFSTCSSVKEFHILPTTPPTLANTNAFQSIPADCIIYVPAASLETYKTATNWSTYASKMQGE